MDNNNDIVGLNASHVKSVVRSLMLLDLLTHENREMSLTEISKFLKWPKTTVYGIISTLRDYHYVDQSPDTGYYRLGVRLFEIGNVIARNWDVRTLAKPFMHKLNTKLGEMIQLAFEDKDEVLYLEKVDPSHMIRIVSEIGGRLPMYCTGLGKVLLAFKTPAEIRRILSKTELRAMTPYTITNREAMEKELEKIRRMGYAVDDREIMDNLRCIAAPIYNRDGNVEYAISVSCLASNMQNRRFNIIRDELLRAASDISFLMGYRKL